MKRDMDLIRRIMLDIEESDGEAGTEDMAFDGWTSKEIDYNAQLLYEGGLIDGIDAGDLQRPFALMHVRMTMQGHDFLDSIRDPDIWSRVKDKLKAAGGTATLDVVKQVAVKTATEILLG